MAGKSDPNFGIANRDQPEKCVVAVTVDTTGLVKAAPCRRRLHGSLAMGFLGDAGEVSVENLSDRAPTRDVAEAELRGLEAHSCSSCCRSSSESTLLHGDKSAA